MGETVLELTDVTAGYGDTTILQGISLQLARGDRLAIIGRNGVGKTTLLNTVMGLTRMRAGSIRAQGAEISRLPAHKRVALGLGLVPQTRDIFPSLSVEENIVAGLRGDATVEEAFALFPRLKERRRNGGGQLSGGEQQMLSIARTLMGRPEVVLLDEPLEGLAPVICDMLMETFEQLASDGRHTILLVEQHAGLALEFADRVLVLDQGRVVHHGPAKDLAADAELLDRLVGVSVGLAEA